MPITEIAHIMVDGYRGTIDFEDETDDDALTELRDALRGSNGEPIRDAGLHAACSSGSPGGGETDLVLFVTVRNPARSLYQRLGFVEAPDPATAPH